MMRLHGWLVVAVVAWTSLACAETPPLTVTNEVFADHMVLQRDRDLTIPGTAAPGASVTVRLDDRKVKTVADATGHWKASLPAMPAGGPFVLEIRSGDQTLQFKDVLFGEVWVCSGQSNMWWPVSKSRDAKKEVAAASYPQIRLLMVKPVASPNARPTDHLVKERDWTPCSPKTVADFSGLAYYFGRQLHRELKVPVGLIQCASCNTQIQPFIRLETLLGTRHAWGANNIKKSIHTYDKQQAALDAWEAADPTTRGAKPDGPKPMTNHQSTSALYSGSIAPMRHHAIRGVIWFQGESNAYGSRSYAELFEMMIRDWRALWGDENMPFIFGQLSGVRRKQTDPNEESGFISVREAQDAVLKLPMTGMAVAADVSTGDVHFLDKQTVGGRLAQTAMGMVYGKDVLTSGPRLKAARFENGKAILTFDHVGDKLVVRGPKITGFAVAGSDGTFHWADAMLNADQSITLKSAAVPEPVAVRHGWGYAPPINVFNSGGLPMVPFRTDTWVPGKKPAPKAASPKPPTSTSAKGKASSTKVEPAKRLLFFGNSFTGHYDKSVPTRIGRLAVADGHPQPLIVNASNNGKDLDYHIEQVRRHAKNNIASSKISGQTYDAIVVQGYSTEATHLQKPADDFIPDAVEISRLLTAQPAGKGSRILLFQTWARQTKHGYTSGPNKQFADSAAMQREIRENYARARAAISRALPATTVGIAPVGDAFEAGRFDETLYSGDLYHASGKGGLLAALVLYRTIYGECVSDIEYAAVKNWANVSQSDWKEIVALADGVHIEPERSGRPDSAMEGKETGDR